MVEAVPFPVEIHFKKIPYPLLVLRRHAGRIAEVARIGMHEDVYRRHVSQFVGVNVPKRPVVIGYAPFHVVHRFHGNPVLVTDEIHEVMVVISSQALLHHSIFQRVDFTDEMVVPVKHVDIFQPVAVGSHFPVGGLFHVL